MASYDSPGYHNVMPGIPDRDGALTASGSPPQAFPSADSIPEPLAAGTHGNTAVITPYGSSLVSADVVQVGARDTLAGVQADAYSGADGDRLTGIAGDLLGYTGAGQGSAGQHDHPNSMWRS